MVVACTQEFACSIDVYERVTEDLIKENIQPTGLLFHWVAELDGPHIRITDVWESREALDQWGARTAAVAQRHEVPEPVVEVLEVSHYQAGADLSQQV